jgi:hypothetical protein
MKKKKFDKCSYCFSSLERKRNQKNELFVCISAANTSWNNMRLRQEKRKNTTDVLINKKLCTHTRKEGLFL